MIIDISKPKKTGIKVLAFDQGGIYIGVDYHATINAFKKLGATNAEQIYSQADQSKIIDEFEQGKVSSAIFYEYLRKNLKGLNANVTDKDLYNTWNAMLFGVIPGVLEFIRELRARGYLTIVVSNADEIHQAGVEEQLREANALDLFKRDSFDERYISWRFGYNKPYVNMFRAVTENLQKNIRIKKPAPKKFCFLTIPINILSDEMKMKARIEQGGGEY